MDRSVILLSLSVFSMDTGVYTLAILTMICGAFALLILQSLIFESLTKRPQAIVTLVGSHGLWLMLIVVLTATLGSLYLSEVLTWNPCKYCWIQRIFMYPMVILLSIALVNRDRTVIRYILPLALLGALFAAYHYYIQMYDIVAAPTNPATPCDLSGESCVKTPFLYFGYITIPMMALTAFVFAIVTSLSVFRRSR
jgi:disulfide bond formation protein DsbB